MILENMFAQDITFVHNIYFHAVYNDQLMFKRNKENQKWTKFFV